MFFLPMACDDDYFEENRRVTGSGEVVAEEIEVDLFEAIDLEGVANVYIETGKPQKVTLTAYENILKYVEVKVVGDELLIRLKEDVSLNTDEEIRLDIFVPDIEDITLSGVGNFYVKGPIQQRLDIELNGVGNVEAFQLPVYEAHVEINGTGKVEVKAKDKLFVDIDGLGNVYYIGDPDMDIDINGLGDVVRETN